MLVEAQLAVWPEHPLELRKGSAEVRCGAQDQRTDDSIKRDLWRREVSEVAGEWIYRDPPTLTGQLDRLEEKGIGFRNGYLADCVRIARELDPVASADLQD
ncbi:hypothetical protein Psi02_70910 [Planotetraspora silvatica]|uniref:Uncharacterized protein n=1 Tax=Planotetraspora silvatica TaxID=234614 RepID=A0A8J3UVL4_9ACTN|nr:hypothetical protein Psi02_70910 [Planotetraspora silvatica]